MHRATAASFPHREEDIMVADQAKLLQESPRLLRKLVEPPTAAASRWLRLAWPAKGRLWEDSKSTGMFSQAGAPGGKASLRLFAVCFGFSIVSLSLAGASFGVFAAVVQILGFRR